MAVSVVAIVAFVGGVVCGQLKSWKAWAPLSVMSGIVTGIAGRLLGVM
jgi:hypothetical protein